MSNEFVPVEERYLNSRYARLPLVALFAGAMALSLLGFQSALQLPGGQGIEDLLGWTNPDSVITAVRYWQGLDGLQPGVSTPERWHVEAVYVLVDTALFMPFYAVLLLLCARALRIELQRDDSVPGQSGLGKLLRHGFFGITAGVVALLLTVDAVENLGGANRVGVQGWVFFGCLAGGALLGVASWVDATHARSALRQRARWVMIVAFVTSSILILYAFVGTSLPSACVGLPPESTCGVWSAYAHQAKAWLALVAVGVLILGWVLWLFGADRQPEHLLPRDIPNERAYRAELRSGMSTIVWRTRYVLLALGIYAGLILGLDQCRDVLLALAQKIPETSGADQSLNELAIRRAGMVTVVAFSVALLVHSTWLWARLACRILPQSKVTLTTTTKAGQSDERSKETWHPDLADRLGVFARTWARVLSLVPLICIYALVAFAISDAMNAAAALPNDPELSAELTGTVLRLVGIGAVTVFFGAVFLGWRRSLQRRDSAEYFNAADNLHQMLSGKDMVQVPVTQSYTGGNNSLRTLLRFLRQEPPHWINTRTIPLVALAFIVLLRLGMAWQPALMAATPPALAIVTLSLVWWMAMGGALGLIEVRHGRPYGLLAILAIGVLGSMPFLGIANNHVLPITMVPASDAALGAQRINGALLVATLAIIAGILWLVMTADFTEKSLSRGRGIRTASLALAWLAAMFAIRLADHADLPATDAGEAKTDRFAPATVPSLRESVEAWARQLPTGGKSADDQEVFLVASEGGGIRSAYWTAQVLLRLRKQYPDFDRRTFAFSGVSGGAMGIAAYSACLRTVGHDTDSTHIEDCIHRGFAALDPLSPLLATWLFEDVIARVLPVPMARDGAQGWMKCSRPACGHLSRAQAFEREWIRAFPSLAQPLSAVHNDKGYWEPHLLLNSTWVETGELAPAASIRVENDLFPGARDVQARLGSELSLIGGAHVAARFPFINPLAAVQPILSNPKTKRPRGEAPSDVPNNGLDGHLADGGYFDNSATVSLMPVWRQIRSELRNQQIARRLVFILIRNGQKPRGCEREEPDGPKQRDCILPPRKALTTEDDLTHPTRRRNWSLYADILGPLVTTLNVSGIGAHGRYAPAALRAETATWETLPDDAKQDSQVMLIDQLNKGALVPLGWYLSPTARKALNAQADCLGHELAGTPEPPDCR